MAYIREKITKSGKYYYLVESHRVNGKVVKEETYIGKKPPWPREPKAMKIAVPNANGRGTYSVEVPTRIKEINIPWCSECGKRHKELKKWQEVNWCPECEARIQLALGVYKKPQVLCIKQTTAKN